MLFPDCFFLCGYDITQFADQVRMRLISQLINDISRVLQKLLKYFNGTTISTSFVPSAPVSPAVFCCNAKEVPRNSLITPLSFKCGSYC